MQIYVLRVTDQMLQPAFADSVRYSEWTMSRGFMVLANSENEARLVASQDDDSGSWWLHSGLTTCELVEAIGEPRIIMADQPTG